MFKYILIVFLLPTILLSSKKTIFIESASNSDYVKNAKEFVFLSDDFIFPSESSSARYLISSKFHKLYIENVIFDKTADRKSIVRTNLFESGKVFEVYNRNIKNILDDIEPLHDIGWIDNYFYTFDGSKISVNKYFHNNIKTIDINSEIKQLKSYDGGKKILLSVLNNGVSKMLLIDTLTGSKNTIAESTKAFFVLLDFVPSENKLLYKEIKKGKSHYFQNIIAQNITTPLPISHIDRDIVEVKYFFNKFLVLFKTPKGTTLRLYDLRDNLSNVFEDLVVNSDITDFKTIDNTIVYRDSNNNLSLFDFKSKETTNDFISMVSDFNILSSNYIFVVKPNGSNAIVNINNHKQITVRDVD